MWVIHLGGGTRLPPLPGLKAGDAVKGLLKSRKHMGINALSFIAFRTLGPADVQPLRRLARPDEGRPHCDLTENSWRQ
jgi:hypothetical protein